MATEVQKKTLEQRHAEHAWNMVQRAKNKEGYHKSQDLKKFGTQVKKLPVRIIASGLGQALAFLKAKDYAPGLLCELADWVLNERLNKNPKTSVDDTTLLQKIIEGDADFLRWATDEVLAYLQWVIRFADAEGLTDETGD